MCGSATLAMVVSRICISIATITPIGQRATRCFDREQQRLARGGWHQSAAGRACRRCTSAVRPGDHRPRRDCRRSRCAPARAASPSPSCRSHSAPAAPRIASRCRRRCWRHGRVTFRPGIGVELDLGGLADRHVVEIGFLVIGLDPGGRAARPGSAPARRSATMVPTWSRLGLADDAVGGRAHLGAGEVEQRPCRAAASAAWSAAGVPERRAPLPIWLRARAASARALASRSRASLRRSCCACVVAARGW